MSHSNQLFSLAVQILPGGVSSPVRSFNSVENDPIFIQRGRDAYLIDVDGKEYIDYVCSWGPLIVGHAHPYIIEKVTEALAYGLSFGAPTEVELRLANKISQLMPSIEMIRFVNSGTEAAMSAIRLARGASHRDKIIKFIGCYHGHADSLLAAAGSGVLTGSLPSSLGVPDALIQHTLLAEFNDLEKVTQYFEKYPDDIACVILEPIACNMNCVPPLSGFLQGLRKLCDQYKSILIFDEVITGFRVALGGAQSLYGIKPDLTILGKIIGGGMPVGAFGGRRDLMEHLAPLGEVYQAGTLSGNPIAMTAGLAQLELITAEDFYPTLSRHTLQLAEGLSALAQEAHIPLLTNAVGGIFSYLFTDLSQLTCEREVKLGNNDLFKQFFHHMLTAGVYLAPSQFEVGFVSSAHGNKEIEHSLQIASEVFKKLRIP